MTKAARTSVEPTRPRTPTPSTGTPADLPLILTAAVHHPDAGVRAGLRAAIEDWVEGAEPRYGRDDVVAHLTSSRGTAIEPFTLEERDLEFAAALVRVAFSARAGQTRFRVVSRETIGTEGGLMLTNNLRSFYIERYALGYRTRTPDRFGFFAPAAMPDPPRWPGAVREAVRATLTVGDTGVAIEVSGLDLQRDMPGTGGTAHKLTACSYVNGTGASLASIGMVAQVTRDGVLLRPGGPEAMVRLTAHMVKRSVVVLAGGTGRKVFVGLEPPVSGSISLRTLATHYGAGSPEWLRACGAPPLAVPRQLKVAIANTFGPHEAWIDADLLREVL